VTTLDRLARALPDARDIADDLIRRQVCLSLGGSVHDPTDPVGRLLLPSWPCCARPVVPRRLPRAPRPRGPRPRYGALLERLLSDSGLRAAWRRPPCTRAGYHAYLGGLLEHTVAVATLALEAAQRHPRLNSDLLICAALVHDLGKTREFTYGAAIELSDEGRLLGHLVLGQQLLEPYLAGLDGERRLALLHCVLSHHGLPQNRQFGSPEALTLYRLNALDASIKGRARARSALTFLQRAKRRNTAYARRGEPSGSTSPASKWAPGGSPNQR
jgi:putative nucleotidyltransferase with HDIG domain